MKKIYASKKTICLAALSFVLSLNLNSQISGTRTIPSANFLSISIAIDSLNTYGVAAPGITFNVAPNHTETFPTPSSGLISITPAPPTMLSPVVFQKSAGPGNNPQITASVGNLSSGTMDGIIILKGVDFVTFNRINLIENPINSAALTIADSTFEWGYALLKASGVNGCQNITIQNCHITLNVNNLSTIGIYSNNHTPTSTTQLVVTTGAGTNSHNLFTGNRISNVGRGMHFGGYNDLVSPYSFYDQNNEIGQIGQNRNTIITSLNLPGTNAFGIWANSQNNLRIVNDSIFVSATAIGMAPTGNSPEAIHTEIGINSNLEISQNEIILNSLTSSYPGWGIRNLSMGVNANVNMNNNIIRDVIWPTFGISQSLKGIENSATASNLSISNNLFTNIGCGTPCGGFVAVRNATNIANTITLNSNSLTASNLHGGLYSGLVNNAGTSTLCTIQNNLISANTIAGGSIWNAIFVSGVANNNSILTNTFVNTTLTGTATVAMIRLQSSSTSTVSRNVMSNLASAGGTVMGINVLNGSNLDINRNTINGLTSTGSNGNISGITVAGGTVVSISNNMIGNFNAPTSSHTNAIIGLQINAATTVDVFYNTIYLNASSSGTGFGTSGIVTNTTSFITLINNLIHNTSTPTGTGITVAHRRMGTSLTTLNAISNNNLYYANVGLGGNRFTYFDGTNTFTTLANYLAAPGMSPRESASISGNQLFVSVSDLHLNLSSTIVQSLGTPIALNIDFDGAIRNANCPEIGAHEPWICLILPIQITKIEAVCGENGTNINWTSETKNDNEFYTVEKSVDGADFTELTKIKSTAKNNNTKTFTVLDSDKSLGQVYYRVSHTDANKITSISEVINTNCIQKTITAMAYPNPCTNQLSVILNGSIGENAEIKICDALNREIEKKSLTISQEAQTENFNLGAQEAGIYFLSVKTSSQNACYKIIRQN